MVAVIFVPKHLVMFIVVCYTNTGHRAEMGPGRSAEVDSRWILRFSFRTGSGPRVKNLGKNGPGSGVTVQFRQ